MSETGLYEQLAEKIMMKNSRLIPRLFEMIADEDEARTLVAMPGTPSQLAEKVGCAPEEMEARCLELYKKGVAFKSFKGPELAFKMCRDLMQFHDASILWSDAPQEYLDTWQEYMEDEWPAFVEMLSKALPKPITRVIPAAIDLSEEARQQILAFENIEEIINSAQRLAVTKCTCRLTAHKCDKPLEVCLQVNRGADYTIDRGSGKEVSKKEALEIIKASEEAGLIHVAMNKAGIGHFICNCCDDCCMTFPLHIEKGFRMNDPSRFEARVDPEACAACETCLSRCYFSAIAMVDHNGGQAAFVNAENCMGCGLCRVTCPSEAITLVEAREREFVPGAA